MFKYLTPARLALNKSPGIIVRTFKSDLKIKWIRPERLSCVHPTKSGDNSPMPVIDKTQYGLDFKNSEELKSADNNVQRLFTLEFLPRHQTSLTYQQNLIDLVKQHQLDEKSFEAKIARLTGRIRYLQIRHHEQPDNKIIFVQCKEMIEHRKRLLKYLRKYDYKRFEWLLEKLDLLYKPEPLKRFNVFRKESLIRLTDIHCDKVRDERLNKYRKELEAQQVNFLAEKLKNLEFIRNEQLELGIDLTVSEEDIATVRKQHDDLKKQREEEMKSVDKSTKWKMY